FPSPPPPPALPSFPTRRSSDLRCIAARLQARDPVVQAARRLAVAQLLVALDRAAPRRLRVIDPAHAPQGLSPAAERFRPLACPLDRKSTRLNSSHVKISYAVFC